MTKPDAKGFVQNQNAAAVGQQVRVDRHPAGSVVHQGRGATGGRTNQGVGAAAFPSASGHVPVFVTLLDPFFPVELMTVPPAPVR